MSDDMERNLGLLEVIAISMGSMIGSGIFILPGVAFLEIGTASVVLAFLIGGILTIPTALSAAELSTAIPESGGSYLYIQRGMGPLLGSIAGIGNWLVLNFKTALALIGGIPYLIYIIPAVDEIDLLGLEPIVLLSILLTILFTVVNAVSAESAGKAQNYIVGLMMLALAMLLIGSAPSLTTSNPAEVFNIAGDGSDTGGAGAFIATISLVFISYAGVIKVTSVAEEIENPGKNIPRGIIISLAVTTFIYVAVTYVTVFTLDIQMLASEVPIAEGGLSESGEGAIIALVAEETIGRIGAIIVVVSALLALASTANSGILSASRYPFSMARDNLAPAIFEKLSARSAVPVYSVLLTGVLVIIMVTFFPVQSVAQFGGAFQVIVFILVNIALIGFREGSSDYAPDYMCPMYPYMQYFGILGGILVLSKIGLIALAGSVVIVLLSAVYYYGYVRSINSFEGTVKEDIREDIQEELSEDTKVLLESEGTYNVLVALKEDYSEQLRESMIQVAQTFDARNHEVRIDIVKFRSSMKTTLGESRPVIDRSEPDWIDSYDNINYTVVDYNDTKEAIVDYATYNGIDIMLHNFEESDSRFSVVNDELEWIIENVPCETLLMRDELRKSMDKVTIVSDEMFYIPSKILLADSICEVYDAELEIIDVVDENTADSVIDSVEEYHKEMKEATLCECTTWIVESDEGVDSLDIEYSDTDLVITELDISTIRKRISASRVLESVRSSKKPFILVYSEYNLQYNTIQRRILMKYIFQGFN